MKNIILICSLMTLLACETSFLGEKSVDPVRACPAIYIQPRLELLVHLNQAPSASFELELNGEVYTHDQICNVVASNCLLSQTVTGQTRKLIIGLKQDYSKYDIVYSEEGSELIRKYSLVANPTDTYSECHGHKRFELSVTE